MGKNIIITEKQFDYIIKNMRNMPMLNEIYQETRNDSYPISLNETNAKRLIDRHTANGYAIAEVEMILAWAIVKGTKIDLRK